VDSAAGGAYRMLVEAHHQFDVVDERHDWSRYRVLILPDKLRLDPDLAAKVRHFTAAGGKVIASHRSGVAADRDRDDFVLPELGVRYLAEARHSPDYVAARPALASGVPATEHVFYERGLEVEILPGAEPLADVWHPYFDRTYAHFCSHRHTPAAERSPFPAVVATESAAYFVHPIFASYVRHGARVYRQLVLNTLRRLLPDPLVETNAPTTARITLMRQPRERRLVAHLLHYIPEQRYREIQTVEDVIPLYNVDLAVRLEEPPRRAYLAPGGIELPLTLEDGRACVTVPGVVGHQMVVFE
jgi:hypothetical protein